MGTVKVGVKCINAETADDESFKVRASFMIELSNPFQRTVYNTLRKVYEKGPLNFKKSLPSVSVKMCSLSDLPLILSSRTENLLLRVCYEHMSLIYLRSLSS